MIQHLKLEKEELTWNLPANSDHTPATTTATEGALHKDTDDLRSKAELKLESEKLQGIITELQEQVKLLGETQSESESRKPLAVPPPCHEEGKSDSIKVHS